MDGNERSRSTRYFKLNRIRKILRRLGTGAFMMLARKFDRIEQQAENCNYDIFKAGERFGGDDGLLDDIGDLRRYLFLVEHHIRYSIGDIDPDADTTITT
jgi:hypothetical protein